MPNPKRRWSKTRRDKRRTHDKLTPPVLATCQQTGEVHEYHRAYTHEGDLYYKGKLVVASEKKK